MYNRLFIYVMLVLLLPAQQAAMGQLSPCRAVLHNDTLVLENNMIKRTFLWNNGALQHIGLYNKTSNISINAGPAPAKGDVIFPGVNPASTNGLFKTYTVAATSASYEYLAAEVQQTMGSFQLKRVFRIYADCPAIVCDYYVKGTPGNWASAFLETDALKNIEDEKSLKAAEGKVLVADKVSFTGNHWKIKTVEFFDATDYNNNLVLEYNRLLYRRENRLRGNVLFASNQLKKEQFFILKEAPVSAIQMQYHGFDFTSISGEIKVAGLGIGPGDMQETDWVSAYSVAVGVAEGQGETGLLKGLRSYQWHQRINKPERDEMIVANTWGDRNQDSRVNETFILQELDAAAALGVTHYQIDDGWQTGISSNSKFGGSLANIWSNPAYWQVNKTKFPNGLQPILDKAKKKGITITLWFNPSNDSSFKNWEKDADVLIAQHKNYGISMWKIDGVQIPDKQADINFRKFLDKVTAATNHEAVFNLDVTAGRRFGYNYMHTYGNLFLENRYTDWTNYYPHFTLRNLWQLSRYIPAQRLQIEFLNKWRNAGKYPAADILAPANYSFDYLFAITMVAQPLAWFEASGLPKEAFTTAALISKYKSISTDLHSGKIFPIGDEPSGFGWTGFQSVQDNAGYLLVFRETNDRNSRTIETWLPEGKKIQLELKAGSGKNFTAVTGLHGSILFNLKDPRSFALYRYTVL